MANELYGDVQILERVSVSPRGDTSKVYRVSAVTKSGVYFSEDIPEKDFSTEKVSEVMGAKALALEEIVEA